MALAVLSGDLAQFMLDCLTVIESGHSLSRHKIRHALSISAPLGTPSGTIDEWWHLSCNALLATDLIIEESGVFFWKSSYTTNVN